MTLWLFDPFGVDPQTVLATPSLFLLIVSGLPRVLSHAWTALHGSWSKAGLVTGSADTSSLLRADSLTCKACYQLLLSLKPAQPHCVVKFRPVYGDLDWDSTWKTLFFMLLDRKLIDLCCPRCFVHCSPPCFFRTECSSWLSLWPLWRNSRAFVLLLSPGLEWSGLDPVLTRPVLSFLAPAISLNFIRLLRVVLTPSVTSESTGR